jgi:nucleoid-associated protein YgaU
MIWDKDTDGDHPHGHMEIHPHDALAFLAKPPQPPSPPPPPPPTTRDEVKPVVEPQRFDYYTVNEGDCLARIAEQHYGKQTWGRIYSANRKFIKNPDLIYPGQRLVIP